MLSFILLASLANELIKAFVKCPLPMLPFDFRIQKDHSPLLDDVEIKEPLESINKRSSLSSSNKKPDLNGISSSLLVPLLVRGIELHKSPRVIVKRAFFPFIKLCIDSKP